MPRKRIRSGAVIGIVGAIGNGTVPQAPYYSQSQLRERERQGRPKKVTPHSTVCSWCDGKKSGYSLFFCRDCGNELFPNPYHPNDTSEWKIWFRHWINQERARNIQRAAAKRRKAKNGKH